MSDTPGLRIFPGPTPLAAVSGTSYSMTGIRGYIPEPVVVEDGKPHFKIIPNNIISNSGQDPLLLIGSITAAEIKIAYESNPDTNAYTDYEKIIVNTIEEMLSEEEQARILADDGLQILINNYITTLSGTMPVYLYQLIEDTEHRVVTDTEKGLWGDKLGPNDLIEGGTF